MPTIQLAHYMANMGCTQLVSRDDVSPRIFEMCLPTLSQGEHRLPLDGYRLIVATFRLGNGCLEGSHTFLFHEARMVAMFTLAMRAGTAEPLWRQFESHYMRATDQGSLAKANWPLPKMPRVTPWVASFPFECSAIEHRFLPEFIAAWAMTSANVEMDAMNRCA